MEAIIHSELASNLVKIYPCHLAGVTLQTLAEIHWVMIHWVMLVPQECAWLDVHW